MFRVMGRAVLAGALGVVGVVGASVPAAVAAPAVAAGETCQGRPATIVGAPGETVRGTDGDDVIVSAGAYGVEAGDGDDVICTTDTVFGGDNGPDVYVLAGPGDDVVDRSGDPDPTARSAIHLDGADDFLGAAGSDWVSDDHPSDGRILTGAGDDHVELYAGVDPHLELDGGDGQDELWVTAEVPGLWTLDTTTSEPPDSARTVTGTSTEIVSFMAFRDADVPQTRVRFTGGAGDDVVRVSPSRMVRGVDMGAGDDRLVLNGGFWTRPDAHATEPLDGGPGTDTIDVSAWQGQHVRVDLADDRLDYRFDNTGAPQNRIPAFENAHVLAGSTRVSGDSGPNDIKWNGCPGVARGRGGDDILRFVGSPIIPRACRSGPPHTAMRGGAGDDQLFGSRRWDDRLVGGAGVDSAKGRGGHDTCQAETTVGCEVVLRRSHR
jgi:hypothetical protein